MDDELETFKTAADKTDNDSITFEGILETLNIIRCKFIFNECLAYLQEVSQMSTTFTSYQKYYDETYKHK